MGDKPLTDSRPAFATTRAPKRRCFWRSNAARSTSSAKREGAVSGAVDWRAVLRGSTAAIARLAPAEQAGAELFASKVAHYGLRPVLLNQYQREPFVSTVDDYARLTIDRRMCVQPARGLSLVARPQAWRPVDHGLRSGTPRSAAVLELKFERRPPRWMVDMVRHLELVREACSKYCYGVGALWAAPEQRTAAHHRGRAA
jgi:hypothetical protein